jgi:hypothetical protein
LNELGAKYNQSADISARLGRRGGKGKVILWDRVCPTGGPVRQDLEKGRVENQLDSHMHGVQDVTCTVHEVDESRWDLHQWCRDRYECHMS